MTELNEFIKQQILRILNTQRKKEIGEKYQASFLPGDAEELPPEIEAEWLNQIEEFERRFENAGKLPLLEFIGSPAIRKMDGLPARELANEFDRLESLLADNGIFVDFPDRLDIRERYRFLSEELILEVIEDVRIPGMNLHFLYEEFHPREDWN